MASISVLHVDDDPRFGDLVAESLEREDDRFDVVTETTAADALDRLDDPSVRVDCVVSDHEVPGTDGLELLDAVREDRPHLPFVLFTGRAGESPAREALSAGATDYLRKGTDDQFVLLANRIRRSVAGARARRDRRRHLDAIESAREGIAILDEEGRFLHVNEAFADRYGYEPSAMVGDDWDLVVRDDEAARVREEVLSTVGDDGYWRGELTGVRADGHPTVTDVVARTSADGSVVVAVRDATGSKRRERQLEQLHAATRDLFAAGSREEIARITADTLRETLGYANNVVRLLSDDGRELRPAAVTQGANTILGDRPTYPVGEGTAGRAFSEGETLVYDDVGEIDDDYYRKDARAGLYLPIGDYGTISINDTTAGVFDDADVRLAELVAANAEVAFDRVDRITDLHEQNRRLDEFTRIVSHDLRNPLNVLEGSIDLAAETGDLSHLERCERAIDRMDRLIHDLLTLARQGDLTSDREPVDLAVVARGCWRNVETDGATLRIETDRIVEADEGRLRQLLENLFRNSVEHGSTSDRPAADEPTDGAVRVTVAIGDLPDGSGFYVEDDGPGIPAAERDEVFERGYSTAESGTGFGLSIVEGVAEAHGWEVTLTGSPDGGARFEIRGVGDAA